MAFTSNSSNEKRVKAASRRVFTTEGEKYSPEYIESHNARITAINNKFGAFVLLYKKWGYISIIGFAVFKILEAIIMSVAFSKNPLSDGAAITSVLFSIPIKICGAGIFVWIFVLISYWLFSMFHCKSCKGFYSMKKIFEVHIPDMDSSFVENRVEKKEIKDTKGKTVGTIDENVNVRVDKKYYYTVYKCKHCNTLSAEITVKQYDTKA